MIQIKNPQLYEKWKQKTRDNLDWVTRLTLDSLSISHNLPNAIRNKHLRDRYKDIHTNVETNVSSNPHKTINLYHNAYRIGVVLLAWTGNLNNMSLIFSHRRFHHLLAEKTKDRFSFVERMTNQAFYYVLLGLPMSAENLPMYYPAASGKDFDKPHREWLNKYRSDLIWHKDKNRFQLRIK